MAALDSFGSRDNLKTSAGQVGIFRLDALAREGVADVSGLPFSIKVLLEALLRNENGREISRDDVASLAAYNPAAPAATEIPFKPARVILQDFTGVPAVVDLAALRSAMARFGGDPQRINPQIPVDLVIDHSVQVDFAGAPDALRRNAELEFSRNNERYAFLRWGQQAFQNFSVVPPASGIVHQVNLEYLANVVQRRDMDGGPVAYPDSLVGTDSHTTMINGLGVVGWGVGGIEAEAVMLGQPIFMLAPEVIGFKVSGSMPAGATATDLVLTVTQVLRERGVVGKFVEFYGDGLSSMTLPDRATLANMAPEYGATMGLFPVDDEVLRYMRATGRPGETVELVERYCKEQGLFRTDGMADPGYAHTLEMDLGEIVPSLAGPKRPQDRVALADMKTTFQRDLRAPVGPRGFGRDDSEASRSVPVTLTGGEQVEVKQGAVTIAAITSCTNTSNPSVMLAAGLLAKKAVAAGLSVPAYVKTSLAPGSKVVTDYLERSGLLPDLEQLGFHVVGYGCTTCIGNSGPLDPPLAAAIDDNDLVVSGVLSGNRNFEGRVSPHVRANYLASPPLVVAYALAGTVDLDLTTEPLGVGKDGQPVFLADIWPTADEIGAHLAVAEDPATFRRLYDGISSSNVSWNAIPVAGEALYGWEDQSTYIQEPPFFVEMTPDVRPIGSIKAARVLVKVGDSTTTDHISPAGPIAKDSPAGLYLQEQGVKPLDFNSYGSRRGNDRVMTRGTFANIRLKNQLAPGTEGGWTTHHETGEVVSIYEASRRNAKNGVPGVVLAGRDYGMGSSRDWAAKGTYLLGVRAVIARSYERIHRSNLVFMGVLPLQFAAGEDAESLGLTGDEVFDIPLTDELKPRQQVTVHFRGADGRQGSFSATCRIDTPVEIDYYRNGGILQTVLRGMM